MNAIPNNLWEFVAPLDSEERFILATVLIVFSALTLVLTIAIIAWTMRSMHRHRLDDALKRELVDRGMDAEEVVEIIRARIGAADPKRPGRPAVAADQQFTDEP